MVRHIHLNYPGCPPGDPRHAQPLHLIAPRLTIFETIQIPKP